ncbi:MAG: phosphatidylserine decarboxylase [Acidobacteria bacterium]|nr:phosphatidylserine decarboxylase [Acidobacteriota bacterium]
MVRDGLYYAGGFLCAAAFLVWLAGWPYAVPAAALAAFFLWFFRDPERAIPEAHGAIVSPADGKVTSIGECELEGKRYTRISIFLNVFDVHVNRSPASGVIRGVEYRRGRFRNAMAGDSSDTNEQNVVALEADGHIIIFKQIAGLLARRIVFTPKAGDHVLRGQRVGLIKFGSRVDVLLPVDAALAIQSGERVQGGVTLVAHLGTLREGPQALEQAGKSTQ